MFIKKVDLDIDIFCSKIKLKVYNEPHCTMAINENDIRFGLKNSDTCKKPT